MTSDNIAQVAIPIIGLGIDARSHYKMLVQGFVERIPGVTTLVKD